ncbi:sterile alpha motif domain-containing protein 10 isoform X4 [Dromiciops gliroides]|uniref:sterile alpha motif domain-containing protein 10 isoform X4 n=1 Tax=Dromiciops gliroides TaxID=33562 RepID=UPI001CC7074F|nr:sterile alpha motif domain-containing protein 10 isoform X4 [Dromiciops gliroides]
MPHVHGAEVQAEPSERPRWGGEDELRGSQRCGREPGCKKGLLLHISASAGVFWSTLCLLRTFPAGSSGHRAPASLGMIVGANELLGAGQSSSCSSLALKHSRSGTAEAECRKASAYGAAPGGPEARGAAAGPAAAGTGRSPEPAPAEPSFLWKHLLAPLLQGVWVRPQHCDG